MRLGRLAAALLLAVLLLASCSGSPQPYAELRQAEREEVPGTWGLVLSPPPSDLAPAISPRRAERLAIRVRTDGDVFATLATVPAAFVGTQADAPAWVVFARDLCFASSKGELVSSSRRDPNDVERCSDANLWIELVDPATGESLASASGYDLSERWLPAQAGG